MSFPRDERTLSGITAIIATVALFGAGLFLVTETLSSEEEASQEIPPVTLGALRFDFYVERQLDTLFVLDTSYLEVRLDSQAVYQHCKSGNVRKFLCSTGNIKIKKAVETTEGIYCVQSKSPIAISRQFDSTKMYFWVGFNGNIGFHGLDGKSYYRFLGKRPSSHGCIRMSREDAEWMFLNIAWGTPVIVHSGNAARCLAFIDSIPTGGVHIHSEDAVRRGMDHQLRSWYRGRAMIEGTRPYYFKRSNLGWQGIPLGDLNRMPHQQLVPPFTSGARTLSECDALCRSTH